MCNAGEFDEKYVHLAIALKVNELKRELSSLTYEHVESMLQDKWKHKKPSSIAQALADINELTVGEVVAFLSMQAIILGSQMKLKDFDDMFTH